MATRAYVQPKTIMGNIQYLNPNFEIISIDKQLIPIDSSIQALNPGNNSFKIILPEVVYCEGMIFDIINTSNQLHGLLEVWEFTKTIKLCDIVPNERRQLICLNNEWRIYDIKLTNTMSNPTISNYSFDTSMTNIEINNIISNIPKCIPPTLTVNLNFADNVFVDTNIVIDGFYGGGKLNIKSTVSGCFASILSSNGNAIEVKNNQNVAINMQDIILESTGTISPLHNHPIYYHDNYKIKSFLLNCKIASSKYNPPSDYPIFYINNYYSILNLDQCRITYKGSIIGNHGIHCDFDNNQPINCSIVSIKNTSFGNLEICIFSQGDYKISMIDCKRSMTESGTPEVMPNTKGYEITRGGHLFINNATDMELTDGTVEIDSFKIIIP